MNRRLKLHIVSEFVNIDLTVVNMFEIFVVVFSSIYLCVSFFIWIGLFVSKGQKNELNHSNPDDKWQFLAKTQSPTRIQALNLYRIVVCSSANAVPACCINVDFPIPTVCLLCVVSIFHVHIDR